MSMDYMITGMKKDNMILLKSDIFVVIVSVTLLTQVVAECPESWATTAEICLQENTYDPESLDLSTPSYQHWQMSCMTYKHTLVCLEDKIEECNYAGGDTESAQMIRDKIDSDIEILCGDNRTFEKYMEHSECFNNQEAATLQCLRLYMEDHEAAYEYRADNRLYEYSDDPEYVYVADDVRLCRAFSDMIKCVNDVILQNCGEDAASLYDDVIISQIPSHVTETCTDVYTPSSASRCQNSTCVLILLIWTLIFVLRLNSKQ